MESIEECAKMEIEAFEEKSTVPCLTCGIDSDSQKVQTEICLSVVVFCDLKLKRRMTSCATYTFQADMELHYDDSISDTLDSDKLSLLHYERLHYDDSIPLHYDDSIPLHYDDSIPLHYDDSIPVPNPFNNWRHGHSILDPNVFSNWSRQDHILDPNVFWNWRRQDRVRDPNVFWNWSRQDHILDPNTFKNRSFEECAKMEIEAFAKKNLEASKKKDTKAFKVESVRHFVLPQRYCLTEIMVLIVWDPNVFWNWDPKTFKNRDPNVFWNWDPKTFKNREINAPMVEIYNHAHVLTKVEDPNTFKNRTDDILELRWHSLLIMALIVAIMALFVSIDDILELRWHSLLIMALIVAIMALFVADPNTYENWIKAIKKEEINAPKVESVRHFVESRQDHILVPITYENMDPNTYENWEINAPKVEDPNTYENRPRWHSLLIMALLAAIMTLFVADPNAFKNLDPNTYENWRRQDRVRQVWRRPAVIY